MKTIWIMSGIPLRERIHRTGEATVRAFAHRLPRRLAYWSFIDSGARYMKADEIVPEVRFMDLLQRFGTK